MLYPNKSGLVKDLLEEARKQVELTENSSGKLRLLEIVSFKIIGMQAEDVLLDCLNAGGTKSYRVEEVPEEEVHITEEELLIPVTHFHKEIYSTFGTPFLLKIKNVRTFVTKFHKA